jgi:hypothetical protein
LDHADQHAYQHADTEEDKVGDGRSAYLVADLRLHPVEIGRTAGEVQFIAALQLQFVEQGQIEPHALDRGQKNTVTGFDANVIVNFADFAITERAVGQNDFTIFLHQQQAVRRRYLRAEQAGGGLHDGNYPGYGDAIAGLDDRCVG